MRKALAHALAILVIMALPINSIAAPKPVNNCKKSGVTVIKSGKKYTCIKSGKKLIWDKGVQVKKGFDSTPTPTPTPTPTASPIVLKWVFKSEIPIIPGTLVDGAPDDIQDQNLNSSFVVQATRDGQVISDVEISWTSTDLTSNIVPFSLKTDKMGLARIWYFAGAEQSQVLEVFALRDQSNSLSVTLTQTQVIDKTVGRYVSTYFSAPGYTDFNTNYESLEVEAIPKSSPVNTYYQLITTWQKNYPTETSFYGGVQQANCETSAGLYPIQVCDKSRGELAGRLALFSAWDSPTKNGPKPPKVASLGPNTRCVPFSHEGSGQSCSQPLNWKVNEKISWKLEVLGEIISGYIRVRSSIALGNSSNYVEMATLDLPDLPNLTTISPFVEEWGGNESPTCLDVKIREMEITKIHFIENGIISKPVRALALGGLYSDKSTRCQNYSITTQSSGITIKSGGKNHWVDLVPIISMNSKSLPLKLGFVDKSQTLWPWQDVDFTPLTS